MMIQTDLGAIEITSQVIADIAGTAATGCFGVKGMTQATRTEKFLHILRLSSRFSGVKVTEATEGGVNIDVHIRVEHGVNITAVCRSVMTQVRYHVERLTGIDVQNVDVYVDQMQLEEI